MAAEVGILEQVRAAGAKRILFLPHAVKSMARPSLIISRSEVESYLPDPAHWSIDYRKRKP